MPPRKHKKVDTSKMTRKQLEAYTNSPEFMAECVELAHSQREALAAKRLRDKTSLDYLWSPDGGEPSESSRHTSSSQTEELPPTSGVSSEYDPPKLEAYLYHWGTSGSDAPGPKLVYRTSRDKEAFVPPATPEAPRRYMRLVGLPQGHKLLEDGFWRALASEVTTLLEKHSIEWTSLDLVRFVWDAQTEEEAAKDENGFYAYGADGPIHFSPVTIWAGVKPASTTGAQAHHASVEILAFLKERDVGDVEVAFRESQVWGL